MTVSEGTKVTRFVLGNVAGLTTDKIWKYMTLDPMVTVDESTNFLRNYHVAIASWVHHVITGSTFSHGFSMSMFVIEAASDHPFGIGDPTNDLFANLALGVCLLGLWGVAEAMKPR